MFSAADDDHFRTFASSLERAISDFDDDDKVEQQRRQMQTLIALEAKFKKLLIAHQHGPWVYGRFIDFICNVQRNILDARPYFREQHDTFSDHISDVLKTKNARALFPFRINYPFIAFVLSTGRFGPRTKVSTVAKEITKLRNEIIVTLMPLGVNRARVFFRGTPKSHLQHMDMIQIACDGFMSGIDKYCPEPDGSINVNKFRSCIIGRAGGDLIAAYSQTLIHFFPADKKKLYRANKLVRYHAGHPDFEKLTEGVNDGVEKQNHRTNPQELAGLMAAASTVSADSSLPSDPDAPEPIERFAAPDSVRPDVQAEEQATMSRLVDAYTKLSPYWQKFLRLTGVRF
jgi:hypothetical protein